MSPHPRQEALILQPRDIELLRLLLHSFTALTRSQICRLFPRERRNTRRRLHRLVQAGYLASRWPSDSFLRPIPLYFLGPKACDALGLPASDPLFLAERDRGKRLRERNLPHFVLTNDVHIRFLTAERDYADYELLAWIPAHHAHWHTLSRYGFPLRPDAYAEYRKGNLGFSVFIELDRSTEHAPRLHQKLSLYADYAASGRFSHHFGLDRFRVLFVVPSTRRRDSIIRAAKHYNAQLFSISTFPHFFSKPLFDPLWKTAHSQDPHDLGVSPSHEDLQLLQNTLP